MGTKKESPASHRSNSYQTGRKVGILGGGQLARMLAQKGAELGLEVHILSTKENDPAAQVVRHWHQGDPNNRDDLLSFFKSVELVTFESEFYSGEMLTEVSAKTKTPVLPEPSVMRQLQDRLSQKESLIDKHIATAEFIAIHNLDDMKEAAALFKNQFIVKKRRGGYDGNGTFIIRNGQDWNDTLEKISIAGNGYIAEAFVPFKRELAVMMARNPQGEIVHFPLVQTQQTDKRCDWVIGPVHHPQFNRMINALAIYLESLKYVGVIAFELFDTGKTLLVNEIAPRVHNSGHYSQNALSIDQFTLHWLAVLGFDFVEAKLRAPAFAMANLIGTSKQAAIFPKTLEGHLHWYGKDENRPGRKMGHINYAGQSTASLLKLLLSERKQIKNIASNPRPR